MTAARKAIPEFVAPISPEPPTESRVLEPSVVAPYDEWEDAQIADADLAGQVADGLSVTRCELRSVQLTGSQLRSIDLVDVLFVDCELSGALMHEARLQRVEFRDCRMAGAVFTQAGLKHVRFDNCKLDDANFRLAEADHVFAVDCSMVQVDCYESTFVKSALEGCDLQDSDFSKAAVDGLRLQGSNLAGLRGALSLGGAVISGDQALPLALSVFSELHIALEG